jgi:transposase
LSPPLTPSFSPLGDFLIYFLIPVNSIISFFGMQEKITKYLPVSRESSVQRPATFIGPDFVTRSDQAFLEFVHAKLSEVQWFSPGIVPIPRFFTPSPSRKSHLRNLLTELEFVRPDDSLRLDSLRCTEMSLFGTPLDREDPLKFLDHLSDQAKEYFSFLLDLSVPDQPHPEQGPDPATLIYLSKVSRALNREVRDSGSVDQGAPKKGRSTRKQRNWLSPAEKKSIVRGRIVEKLSYEEIGKQNRCSRFTVARVMKSFSLKGAEIFEERVFSPGRTIVDRDMLQQIKEYVRNRRGLVTAKTVRRFVQQGLGKEISISGVYHLLKDRLKLSRRVGGVFVPWVNSRSGKLGRSFMAANFLRLIKEGYVPVAMDEAGVVAGDLEKYLWVPKGTPVPRSKPVSKSRVNILLAISYQGEICCQLHKSSTNQAVFINFLDHLLHKLKDFERGGSPRHFLLLDNYSVHRTPYTAAIATKYGIPFLYNASYSCWLNPAEYVFHFVKASLTYRGAVTEYCFVGFSDVSPL